MPEPLSKEFLLSRGSCCSNGCKNCPWRIKEMQSKEELEEWYEKKDPWNYVTTKDDSIRKELILSIIGKHNSVLDIGAGEGFITQDIDAEVIHAIELSDIAASRFSPNIKRVMKPEMQYDLIMTTGTLYKQYDYSSIIDMIKENKPKFVLIAGIEDWLVEHSFGKVIAEERFKYREYIQIIKLYETST